MEATKTDVGRLQQCLPLAVLKLLKIFILYLFLFFKLQQCLPLAVLKRFRFYAYHIMDFAVATVPTACGMRRRVPAEERSDDEVRTSLVPDRRENKGDEATVLTAFGI